MVIDHGRLYTSIPVSKSVHSEYCLEKLAHVLKKIKYATSVVPFEMIWKLYNQIIRVT